MSVIKALPVFVGSTFTDLRVHRDSVQHALQKLQAVVCGMEFFGSLPETPKEECLRIVRTCRAYVGIFGMRYGSIDALTGKSLTQLEYEEAQRIHLPSLIYLLDEQRHPVLPTNVEFGIGAEKLQAFKKELYMKHVVSHFSSAEDLAARVSQDIVALASRNGFEVREGELSRIVSTIPRIDWLDQEHFSFLKRKVAEAAENIPSDAVLREVIEFLLSGDRSAAAFLVSRATPLTFRASIDCVMAIDAKLATVIEEGTKRLKQGNP